MEMEIGIENDKRGPIRQSKHVTRLAESSHLGHEFRVQMRS